MPRILRLAGWIHIVLATALALLGLASVLAGPDVAGERLLAIASVAAGWVLATAIGAALVGFARVVEDVRAIRDRLEERPQGPTPPRRPFEPLDMGLLHSPTGVTVHSVAADGLSARVGLRKDDLIVAVNGTPLTTFPTHEERVAAVAYSRPARLRVLREEGEVDIRLR